MTTARRTHRLALAGATALALGAAACGPPVDLEVGAGPVQPEAAPAAPRPAEPSSASTPVAPAAGEDLGTPVPGEEPPEPEALEPTSEDTATDEPTTTPDEPTQAPDESPTPTEPTTEEPEAEEPTVLEDGDQGEDVLALQQQLAGLGYWVGSTDGHYGHLTEQAVLAFQGWEGLARDGVVGPRTRAALDSASRPVPEASGDGIEIHRTQQVLLVVRDGRTELALHTSTGSGETYTRDDGSTALADTPAGTWEIAWRVDGWRESDLGRLYRPVYFHEDGIAVHGYPEVPSYPASHGCARVSMTAMDMLWAEGHVTEGTRVVVT